jgi:hypothetical protein
VNLGLRLISDKVRIEAMSKENTATSNALADKRSRWLTAAWYALNDRHGRNLIDGLAWQSLVLGRHALQVQWIKDKLPDKMLDTQFPMNVRILDPRNVGVERGPFGVEWAYHKYECELWEAIRNWPNIKNKKAVSNIRSKYRHYRNKDEWRSYKVTMTDMWWMGDDGSIWNAVLMDDEFVKEPKKTDYPLIPIIEGLGDTAETPDESLKGMSILYSLDGLWQYQCRAMSQMATGMLWYFWPYVYVENEQGYSVPDVHIRPGNMEQLPAGTRVNVVQIEPNMALSNQIMGILDTNIQQATFPGVMYGDAPGSLQAGYGVAMLADAARGRMRSFLSNLQRSIQAANKLMMGLVYEFDDDDEGIEVWGRNVKDEKLYSERLHKDDLEGGYYENDVELKAQVPEDDTQRITVGQRLAESRAISWRTFRDKWIGMEMPDDEENRIFLENAMMGQELGPKIALGSIMAYHPDNWQEVIRGTPLEQLAQMAGLLPPPPPPPGMGPGGMGPPGMGPEGMPPEGMGPGMPPDMGGGVPMQPDAIAGGMGSPIPPEMQGQMTPEGMGMDPGMDPVVWAQLMGRPLPPGEEEQVLRG